MTTATRTRTRPAVHDAPPFEVADPQPDLPLANPRAIVGDNQPPAAATLELIAESLAVELGIRFALNDAEISRLLETARGLPKDVVSTDEFERTTQMIKDLREVGRTAEASRVREKAPYLAAERVIDEFFRPFGERIKKAMDVLQARVKAHLDIKAEMERKARETAARLVREQAALTAERARQEALKAERARKAETQQKHLERAATADMESRVHTLMAEQHELAAAARPADLARTRTATGTTATLKTEWTFEITDIDAIPIERLRPYIAASVVQQALRAFVRAGGRELAGVRIYETTKADVR